jgi:WD40 repeat protein
VGGREDGIRLWDARLGRELRRLPVTRQTYALAFSPDGRLLAGPDSGEAGGAALWDVATGQRVRRFDTHPFIRAIAFAPDGQRVAMSFAGVTQVIDVRTGGVMAKWPGSTEWALADSLAFSPDGKLLAAAGDDGLIMRDLETGDAVAKVPSARRAVTFSPDGRFMATAQRDSTAIVWDVARVLSDPAHKPARPGSH